MLHTVIVMVGTLKPPGLPQAPESRPSTGGRCLHAPGGKWGGIGLPSPQQGPASDTAQQDLLLRVTPAGHLLCLSLTQQPWTPFHLSRTAGVTPAHPPPSALASEGRAPCPQAARQSPGLCDLEEWGSQVQFGELAPAIKLSRGEETK